MTDDPGMMIHEFMDRLGEAATEIIIAMGMQGFQVTIGLIPPIEHHPDCPIGGEHPLSDEEIFEIRAQMEAVNPSTLAESLDRDRPYSGQTHTFTGLRGAAGLEGITYRDLRDCFIRGLFEASGLEPAEQPGSLYQLPLDEIDPLITFQHMALWLERYQGTFPNTEESDGDSPL